MTIRILRSAKEDLIGGYQFYERQEPGVGPYFLDCLFADIQALQQNAGVHKRVFGFHRLLSKRFPFAVYYSLTAPEIEIHAVLDCRGDPSMLGRKLRKLK
jgi:hypothetical protein